MTMPEYHLADDGTVRFGTVSVRFGGLASAGNRVPNESEFAQLRNQVEENGYYLFSRPFVDWLDRQMRCEDRSDRFMAQLRLCEALWTVTERRLGFDPSARRRRAHLAAVRARGYRRAFDSFPDADLSLTANNRTTPIVQLAREARREFINTLTDARGTGFADPESEFRSIFLGERNRPVLFGASDRDAARDGQEVAEAACRFLLPRFSWLGAARVVWPCSRRGIKTAVVPVGASLLVVACALTLWRPGEAGWFGWTWLSWAAITAGAGFACLVVAAFWVGDLLLLRLPASTLVGLGALVTFDTRWLSELDVARGRLCAVGVAVFACAYLSLEARQHGVRRRLAAARGLGIGAIGLLYATATTPLLFATVVPIVQPDFAASLVTGSDLAAASTLAFGFGVLVQVLWDDRPITAPLGHLERALDPDPEELDAEADS
jgi:hypothetical protein